LVERVNSLSAQDIITAKLVADALFPKNDIEKIGEYQITSVKFHSKKNEIIDIDSIFRQANVNYASLLERMGLPLRYDFSKRNDKKLYTHEFIKTFMDFLQTRNDYTPFFFSNQYTKDKTRNILINKLRRIFGIRVWEDTQTLSELFDKLENLDCDVVTGLEMFFDKVPKKDFRKIRKYLEKEGLINLNEVYFDNLKNKMGVMVK